MKHQSDRGPFGMIARSLAVAACALLLLAAGPVLADNGTPAGPDGVATKDVGFTPHMDRQVPADMTFRDENGQTVRLGDYFGRVPVILTLNYYDCQNLCPLQLQTLTDTMVQVPFRLGYDYSIVTVSIDPNNTPQSASNMKAEVMHRYKRVDAPSAAAGWHFLSGDQASITALAQQVGFRYAYDPVQKDYAHPIGAMLLTPAGRIARYLYGMDFPANDLRLALVEASQGKISTPIDAVLLLCYHYSLETGRYTAAVMTAVRAGGMLTLLVLGSFLMVMWRRDLLGRGRGTKNPPAGGTPGAGA